MTTGETGTEVARERSRATSTAVATATGAVRAALADGRVVLVRPLNPDDQDRLLALHEGLDERDRYFRFFGPLPARVADLVFGMCAPVDNRHASMGAFLGEELIGVAHYEVLADPTRAEVALAVSGTTQANGVGTLLLEHLISLGRRRGVRLFLGEVLTENTRMLRVFRDCGLPRRITYDGSVTRVELTLDEVSPYLDAMAERERVADVASLSALLRPRSVAVIGAGRTSSSIGHAVLRNILAGGYTGQVYPVNPHTDAILDLPAYPTVAALPAAPELAVICLPAHAVADIARQCGEIGVRAIVVVAGGLDQRQRAELLAVIRQFGMRLVGPNCVGIANSAIDARLDATFAPTPAPTGSIGLATQSGGIAIALREQLRGLGLGLSTMVSTGDKYDVSGNDLLMWWLHDERTTAVALYLESFGNPRKFGRIARRLARSKPVLALRVGDSPAAARAAASHTSATATPSVTRDALFRQAGIITVDTPAELLGTLAALSWQPLPSGNRLAVVTNAGGAGVLAADACADAGLTLAQLAPQTIARLRGLLPEQASLAQPVDTTAGVDADTFVRVVTAVRDDPGVDAVVAATVPTALGDPSSTLGRLGRDPNTPVLAVRLGQSADVASLHTVTASFADPADAVRVVGRLAAYVRWRGRPEATDTPPADVDVTGALAILREQFEATPLGGWLDPRLVVRLLDCFGIPQADTRFAPDADEAARVFTELGARPVAVKAVANGLLHKTEQGGIVLDVRSESLVRDAGRMLADRFGRSMFGLQLQPMAVPGRELQVGVHSDGVFGPLVVFGLGGVDTDVISDRVARLAPLAAPDIDELIAGLRSSATLFGPQAHPALDMAAVREVLRRVGLLAELLPEVAELDLNPLIVWSHGCQVVDARVRIAPVTTPDPFLPTVRG